MLARAAYLANRAKFRLSPRDRIQSQGQMLLWQMVYLSRDGMAQVEYPLSRCFGLLR